jgi:hypothetical protein
MMRTVVGAPGIASARCARLPTGARVDGNERDVDTAETPIAVAVEQVEPHKVLPNQQTSAKARDGDLAQSGQVMGPELDANVVRGSQGCVVSAELQPTRCPLAIHGFAHGDRVDIVAWPVVAAADGRRVLSHEQSPEPSPEAGAFRCSIASQVGAPFPTPGPHEHGRRSTRPRRSGNRAENVFVAAPEGPRGHGRWSSK